MNPNALEDGAPLLGSIELALAEALGPERRALAGSPLLEAARRLCLAGGKRVRPRLVVGFGRALGAGGAVLLEAAVAAELLHAASLLHDDVIDQGRQRRGQATANVVWGNTVAVLAGDLLVSLALERLRPWPRLSATAVRVVTAMTEASMLELDARRKVDLTAQAWRLIAAGKTGELFGWCCAAGARWVGDDEAAERLARCGRHLGVAFQLADDLVDLVSNDKDRFADLRNGNPSYPLVMAAHRSRSVRDRLAALWQMPVADEAALRACGELLLRSRAVEDTRAAIADELAQARAVLGAHGDHPEIAQLLAWAESLRHTLTVEGSCAAT
jgi:heptaprenyl diphosphate synthase